jgi:transcriptional regulator with XRE-family HTH domain
VKKLSVAQSIQTYLKDHGIKQAFIAEKCGWSKQKTSCIISGRSKMAADDFLAICDVIGVPYDYFNDRLEE